MVQVLIRVLPVIIRYVVAGISAKTGLSEAEGKTLYDALTDPEVLLSLATFVWMVWAGVRSWVTKEREKLTAQAMNRTVTAEEVKQMAKTSAPVLATDPNTIPELRRPFTGW